jgi:hypothetical protein
MYQQVYAQSIVVLVPLVALQVPPPPFFENVSEHHVEVTIVGPVSGSGVSAGGA